MCRLHLVDIPTKAQRQAARVRQNGDAAAVGAFVVLHWVSEAAAAQPKVPAELTVDTFGGRAWVGLVPFFLERMRLAGLPVGPGISGFLELNVRA